MRWFLVVVALILSFVSYNQIQIKYDFIETFNWSSGWSVGYGNNSGYYTNAFVSSTSSAALIGTGNGTSQIEEGWYVLPNVTGLNSASSHTFRFRLGAYKFGAPSAATAGVDAPDYIQVYISTNNLSTPLVSEIKITGFNNSLWNYNTAGVINKTANGVLSTYTPAAGGDRTVTGDGYSVINLTIPSGATEFLARVYTRVNSAGEEWWLDNFELIQDNIPLPVELTYFFAKASYNTNILYWQTATENNSSHFEVEKSEDGLYWISIGQLSSMGNSTVLTNYNYLDADIKSVINYYRLRQVDNDGNFKLYGPISIDNTHSEIVPVMITNLIGQLVDKNFDGPKILIFSDGTRKIQY